MKMIPRFAYNFGPTGAPDASTDRILRHQLKLDGDKLEQMTGCPQSLLPEASAPLAEVIRTEAAYFVKNAHHMRCPDFRAPHLFAGSGVIEAGAKQ